MHGVWLNVKRVKMTSQFSQLKILRNRFMCCEKTGYSNTRPKTQQTSLAHNPFPVLPYSKLTQQQSGNELFLSFFLLVKILLCIEALGHCPFVSKCILISRQQKQLSKIPLQQRREYKAFALPYSTEKINLIIRGINCVRFPNNRNKLFLFSFYSKFHETDSASAHGRPSFERGMEKRRLVWYYMT